MAGNTYDFLNFILDPIFQPLIRISSPLWFLIIVTFLVTLLITLIYKYTTNQELVKRLRDEMKDIQKQIKESQHDLEKVKQLQKDSFEKMGQQFKQSMKPMFITMIPMIIILGWLAGNLSYESIKPGEEFNVEIDVINFNTSVGLKAPMGIEILDKEVKHATPTAMWKAKGDEGNYVLEFTVNGDKGDKLYTKEVKITKRSEYLEPIIAVNDGIVRGISVGNKPLKIFGLSWFWAYFIFAIVFNSLLRKLLKVY